MHTIDRHNDATLSLHSIFSGELSASGQSASATRAPMTFATLVKRWVDVARSRRQLSELDPRLLRDIGLTREAALKEAEKPFWR